MPSSCGMLLGRLTKATQCMIGVLYMITTMTPFAVVMNRFKTLTDAHGGRRSPAVECWVSDPWVASSNPLRDKFRH